MSTGVSGVSKHFLLEDHIVNALGSVGQKVSVATTQVSACSTNM